MSARAAATVFVCFAIGNRLSKPVPAGGLLPLFHIDAQEVVKLRANWRETLGSQLVIQAIAFVSDGREGAERDFPRIALHNPILG
jgi:hypothetical protein